MVTGMDILAVECGLCHGRQLECVCRSSLLNYACAEVRSSLVKAVRSMYVNCEAL